MNPSGLTPENKKAPVVQDKHVKPANPPPVSGEASTSASKPLVASLAAAKITERSDLLIFQEMRTKTNSARVVSKKYLTWRQWRNFLEAMSKTWILTKRPRKTLAKKELGAKAPEQQNEDISYAKAASSIGYKVLYVHSGVKDCDPIKENVFFKLWEDNKVA